MPNEYTIIVGRHIDPGAQYIGRGSPLGNPFVISIHGNRMEVCQKYKTWFYREIRIEEPILMTELQRLLKILIEKKTITLGCFCSPKQCHGETVKEYLLSKLS